MTSEPKLPGPPKPPDVSFCIPTYDRVNGRADRLADSIIQHTRVPWVHWEIVMEDCQGQLRGYTEPMNKAMARANARRCLVAFNDDVVVAPGWLPPLLAPFSDPDVWCVTPDATHTDGPQVFHPWCMVWRVDAWFMIGGLDERFVLWGSDIDIARRLVDAGHPPVKVTLPVPITHELNATSSEHPELGPVCVEDLERFRQKWGTDAESEKHRLQRLTQ